MKLIARNTLLTRFYNDIDRDTLHSVDGEVLPNVAIPALMHLLDVH